MICVTQIRMPFEWNLQYIGVAWHKQAKFWVFSIILLHLRTSLPYCLLFWFVHLCFFQLTFDTIEPMRLHVIACDECYLIIIFFSTGNMCYSAYCCQYFDKHKFVWYSYCNLTFNKSIPNRFYRRTCTITNWIAISYIIQST